MSRDFEFQVEFYVVSMAYNPEYTPWTALIIDSVRGAGGLRTTFTVFFIPNGRDRYQSLGYGTYSGPGLGQRNHLWLDRIDFESFYAILRSERPAFLRGGGSDATVEYLELYSGREPVGEGDTSLPRPAVTGEILEELRLRLRT
jgi:hypothetical protein